MSCNMLWPGLLSLPPPPSLPTNHTPDNTRASHARAVDTHWQCVTSTTLPWKTAPGCERVTHLH